jgi:hypothetical protein
MTTGAVVGWIGSYLPLLMRITAVAVVGVLCAIWALAEIKLIAIPMPQWPRQVQRQWLGNIPWGLVALGYGFQLGSAVATRIKITTTYAALCCALLAGSASSGAVIMAAFAAARAIPALVVGPWVTSPDRSRRFAVALDSYAGTVARANATILLVAGILLGWTSWMAATGVGSP